MLEYPKVNVQTRFIAALIDWLLSAGVSMIIPVIGSIISTAYMLLKDGLFDPPVYWMFVAKYCHVHRA